MRQKSSLLEFLDTTQVNCGNESASHDLKSILSTKSLNTSSAYLESDADEQLLINIPVRSQDYPNDCSCLTWLRSLIKLSAFVA